MAQLTIWHGGVKVFPLKEPEIVAPTTLNNEEFEKQKFSTCQFRTDNQESRTVRTCCSSVERTGYACKKLGIFPLAKERCQGCLHYQAKQPAA